MSGDGFLHGTALLQTDLLSGQGAQCHSNSDHAHTADLNQQNDHGLAKAGPIACGVVYDQSRHTHGGGSGEQRVGKARPLPCLSGEGET